MVNLPRRKKQRIKVCSDHLPDFYEALKDGNLKNVKKFEHELTMPEECVACAYILKARNERTREEAEKFLAREGVLKYISSQSGQVALFDRWWADIVIYLLILAAVYLAEFAAKWFFLNFRDGLFAAGALEMMTMIVVSLVVFLLLDK